MKRTGGKLLSIKYNQGKGRPPMEPEIYRQMRKVEDHHWWFRARRSVIRQVIPLLELPPQARILDIGSGTGGNLAMLSDFGSVMGMEKDEKARKLCLERKAAPVVPGELPHGVPPLSGKFDLVVMLDVLEHIPDDLAALKAVEGLLNENGRLLLTVPAFPFLWSSHDTQHHHVRRYRRASLSRLIRTASLRVNRITYYNTILFPLIAVARLYAGIRPTQEVGRDLRIPPAFINVILRQIFSFERHLVGRIRLPFGTSLLALASKSRGGVTENLMT